MNKKRQLSFPRELESAKLAHREMLFWRAEYVKRWLIEFDKDSYKAISRFVSRTWLELKNIFTTYPEVQAAISGNELFVVQHCAETSFFQPKERQYIYNNVDLYPFFSLDALSDEMKTVVFEFMKYSDEIGYFVSELFKLTSMDELLKGLRADAELPQPPLFHANYSAKGPLPTEVLEYIWPGNTVKLPEPSWQPYQYEMNEMELSPLATEIKFCNLYRSPDFIILAQVLAKDFDLDVAVEDIRRNMAWYIHRYKVKHDIPLTDAEHRALLDFYENETDGNYGHAHSIVRAGGLWIWDYCKENGCSIRKACKLLQDSGLIPSHSASSYDTIKRWYDTTRDSIEFRTVLPVNKVDRLKVVQEMKLKSAV